MKSYYDILEINKDTDAQKIKSAYYKMVRKYSPERFPEEFKQLHEAYETLSDTEKRSKYDSIISMPESAFNLYEQAQSAKKQGQHLEAERLMNDIIKKHPKLGNIKAELATWYENKKMPGKAIKLMESLCNDDPENSEYTIKLADLYLSRGWKKKSLVMFEKAERLNPKSEAAWIGILQASCRTNEIEKISLIYNKATKSLAKHGIKSADLNFMMFLIYASKEDDSTAEACLNGIIDALQSNGYSSNYINEDTLGIMFSLVLSRKNVQFIPHLRKIVDLIPTLKDNFKEPLEYFELIYSIETIEKNGYDFLFHDLLGIKLEDCDCEEYRFDLLSMECNILVELDKFRPQILQLQKEYPELYALHSDFFKEVMLCRDPEKLLNKRLKILAKNGYSPAFLSSGFADQGSTQTVRRESEKIGRNDPCPCGSGKKYKKCCG